MKQKNKKITKMVLISLIIYSSFILLFVFLVQILLLDNFYEAYKKRQLESIEKEIIASKDINRKSLEKLAFDKRVCISVYSNGKNETISNIYNRGCIIGDKKTGEEYIEKFILSNKKEDSIIVYGKKFSNKTLVKAIKYSDNIFIFINSSLQPLDSSIKILKGQFGYIVVVSLLVSILIGYIISKRITTPITKLSDSAQKIANGNYDASFDVNTNLKEIKELASTLTLAKSELSKIESLKNDLMANVGHDLKTPLTMIKAYAEMTRDFKNLPLNKRSENMDIIIEETD